MLLFSLYLIVSTEKFHIQIVNVLRRRTDLWIPSKKQNTLEMGTLCLCSPDNLDTQHMMKLSGCRQQTLYLFYTCNCCCLLWIQQTYNMCRQIALWFWNKEITLCPVWTQLDTKRNYSRTQRNCCCLSLIQYVFYIHMIHI